MPMYLTVTQQVTIDNVLSFVPATIPPLAVGTAMTPMSVGVASGGMGPYTFLMQDQNGNPTTPPPGLSLSAAGILSGTPTANGAYSLTFTIKDSSP